MATGITKREQHSTDALSASDFFTEPHPLPGDNAAVELSYKGKIDDEQILVDADHQYYKIGSKSQSLVDDWNHDAIFVLDDNYLFLNRLLSSGEKASLIYLDPPYGTGFDFHSRDLEHAYKDKMGLAPYLEFMRRRLIIMRECLADDGSIYLHIGHQMLSHLKIIMDEVFGRSNFRNLITRRKCSSKNFTTKQYANLNDYVLFYSKGKNYQWEQPGVAPEKEWIEREYPKFDELGRRYKLVPVHAPGTRNGDTGREWRGKLPPLGKHWQYSPKKLDELDAAGDIYWSKNGNPRRKVYLSSDKKRALTDYWEGYRDAYHQSIKITGYPTEKNLNMLRMIVQASSSKGDLVIDPFCGSGTTLHAAAESGRRFIGIDASFVAAKAAVTRMRCGLQPMGDYVNGKRKSKSSQVELQSSEIDFIVNERLLAKYKKEIREIATI